MKHHRKIITITVIGLAIGLIITLRPSNSTDEKATITEFEDIELRCYDRYDNMPDSVLEKLREYTLLLPYIYVVDKRYLETRLTEDEALALGVSAETYRKHIDNTQRSNELFSRTDIKTLGMEWYEKYYDAIRSGELGPNKTYPLYHPQLPSIRIR